MARWRLQGPHYLMTDPPAEWESKETDRNTGRQARKVFKVGRYLDPKDPSDCNYPETGDVIVCNGNNPQPRDIIFTDDPSQDMEPIDDEAKKITKSFVDSGKWTKREEGMDYGESLIKKFMDKMDKMELTAAPVDSKAFTELQNQVKELMAQNAELRKVTPLRRT